MSGEKPFEATASRLARAKREGDAARSQELVAIASCAAAATGVLCVASALGSSAREAIAVAAAQHVPVAPLALCGVLMLVPAAFGCCGATLCAVLQSGGLRFSAIACRIERLSPSSNLQRILSRETVIGAGRAILAFCVAGSCAVAVTVGNAPLGPFVPAAARAWHAAVTILLLCCAVGACFALADYRVQVSAWLRRLRMSAAELKQDHKEHDGDPIARSRRRSLHRRFAQGSMLRLRDASFVVTNPTHLAVALQYRPPEIPVPRVLLRAADEAAHRVRRLAAQLNVPVVEHAALARSIYATSSAGEYVAAETYVALAELIVALRRSGALQ